jgi:hypothetical protein
MKIRFFLKYIAFIFLAGTVFSACKDEPEQPDLPSIDDVVAVLSLAPTENGLYEVLTPVTFLLELLNLGDWQEEFLWAFPEGMTDENGNAIKTSDKKNPGALKFGNVGLQTVSLQIKLDKQPLEELTLEVPVAYNQEVPTLYYAVRRGNIMALKLAENLSPAIVNNPFDMGVFSGATPFNILFNEPTDELFILDAGVRFTFMNPVGGAPSIGDGDIRVMSADGSQVETVLINRGHEFNDPFFGFIYGDNLYYSDRNTGVISLPLSTRNLIKHYTLAEQLRVFANDRTCFHGNGINFGAINSGFFRKGDVWWWGKSGFNSIGGLFRFSDEDIHDFVASGSCNPSFPPLLAGVFIRGVLWDDINQMLYFTTIGITPQAGLFRATIAQLEAITRAVDIEPFRLRTEDGENLIPIVADGRGEGSFPHENIGIPQLALNRATGNVYFGFRSGNPNVESGLMRFNAATGYVEHVITGLEGITGVAINNNRSKLF